jgi:hypothetical protein
MSSLCQIALVAAATAFGLGLVTLTFERTEDHIMIEQRPTTGIDQIEGPAPGPTTAMSTETLLVTRDRPGAPASETQQSVTFNSWKSKIHARNDFTLWDQIRVSSQLDRRAFLLGTAIQIHAPETAATPGPRDAPSP